MKKITTRQKVWGIGAIIAFMLLVMVFTPVPQPIPENCKVVEGKVLKVYSPCCQDVGIKLEADEDRYYINRGLERGIDVEAWQQSLEGQVVQLSVIRRNWTPLDPSHSMQPVAELRLKEQVYFSAIKSESSVH